jgi:amino acid transporter
MIYSLIICTVLYILIALVLTGMVNYTELKVDDPLAYVFQKLNLNKIGYLISVSAVVATTSVLLVFQLGQPRIWMSMSRDGLLPKKFAQVHPKFGTPSFATIVTGLLVGIPSLFVASSTMTDLTSIGTLFAFVLVCFGVLVLPRMAKEAGSSAFRLPYLNGQFIIPAIVAIFVYFSMNRIADAFNNYASEGFQEILFLIFIFIAIVTGVLSFVRKYSVIPVVGALCCLYLMIEIPAISWMWFFIWMGIGLTIYFFYSRRRSKLAQ